MLRCKKCGRVTNKGEPTGLLIKYISWKDKNRKNRKDILSTLRVCNDCAGDFLWK